MRVSQEGGDCLHLAATSFFSVNFCLLKRQSCKKRWQEGNSKTFPSGIHRLKRIPDSSVFNLGPGTEISRGKEQSPIPSTFSP